ncbi:unnamed protein product [Closterium sp. NIES-53]
MGARCLYPKRRSRLGNTNGAGSRRKNVRTPRRLQQVARARRVILSIMHRHRHKLAETSEAPLGQCHVHSHDLPTSHLDCHGARSSSLESGSPEEIPVGAATILAHRARGANEDKTGGDQVIGGDEAARTEQAEAPRVSTEPPPGSACASTKAAPTDAAKAATTGTGIDAFSRARGIAGAGTGGSAGTHAAAGARVGTGADAKAGAGARAEASTGSVATASARAAAATAAPLATAPTAAMASPTVRTFDSEGRAVDFHVWVDDLQLFLQCDSRDGVSLFYHTSGVSTAPTGTADSTVLSQWTTRDAVARLAVRSHLPLAERTHFGQYKTAQSLYDAVVTRYSSPAEALHTFTLDSSASHCFFRESTTLTPLPAPVPVRLADPSRGPVIASSSTVLPCPAFPSGSLSGLHLTLFSTNLVSTAALQDAMVTTTTPGGSSLYALATEPPQVAASAQVSASGQVAASCSCRLLSHQTLLWHHRLGHPSLPHLREMHSRLLVSGLPRSLNPLPPSPAPPCLPCIEGRQRAAPHSSSFPATTAPLQTLHMDVWGPVRVSGQGRERYFLLVVDDYTRYTIVFPLRSKDEVAAVLIPWIRTGITQSFTLPDSPQQNGIVERRIGLVMEVARTSMIHAAAPHFQWPFAVRYAAHQLNLWPHVSLPETSPTLRWTGKVGDASVFRVWGSRAFVCDTSADKLSARAIPCVFLGFVPDAPGWLFYHPTSRCVLPSQDVTFDESVPFYRLFPYRSAPSPPSPLFLAPGPPPVDPLPPQGPAPSGVSQVDPLPSTAPVQVAVVPGAAPGAASGGAASGGAEPGGAGSKSARYGGAEPEGVEPRGAESEGPTAASPRLSSQQLREWLVQCPHRRSGAPGAGKPGDTGAGGAAVTTGAGDPTELGAAGAGSAGAGVAGVGGPGAGGARAA